MVSNRVVTWALFSQGWLTARARVDFQVQIPFFGWGRLPKVVESICDLFTKGQQSSGVLAVPLIPEVSRVSVRQVIRCC